MILRLIAALLVGCFSAISYSAEMLGTVDYARVYYLDVGSSGKVKTVSVEEGSRVLSGTLLLTLENSALQSARQGAEAKQAYTLSAQSEAERAFDRDTALYEEGSLSTVELSLREVAYLRAKSDYAEASASLALAEQALALSRITAPESGVVLRRLVGPGMVVSTQTDRPPLLVFASDRKVVRIDIASSADGASVVSPPSLGDTVQFSIPGQAQTLVGTVKVIDTTARQDAARIIIVGEEPLPAIGQAVTVRF